MKHILFVIFISLYFNQANSQVKNLVMEGGGIRGIAYVGALKALDENGQLNGIENIGGTSVGGITAALLSVGYTPEELKDILSNLKFQKFNDGRGIFIGGMNRTFKRYGWYRGEKITEWIEDLIFEKTGRKNLTFGELYQLSKTSDVYKNLYVTATNLSSQNWEVLSVETYPNMRIADAVRISASIPIYYTAIFMDSCGNLYDKPQVETKTSVMADGGFLSNYPIHIFDEKYPSNETIGLRLDNDQQISEDEDASNNLASYEINNIKDYVGAFYNLVIENLNRSNLTPTDWERTISISTCGIGPKIKRLSNQEVKQLTESGYNAVQKWIN